MVEGCGRPYAVAEVVAIVCPIGEVEGFGNQLDIRPIMDLDVLGEASVELEERVAAQRIVRSNGAAGRHAIEAIEAILCARVVACECKVVLGVCGWHDYANASSAASIESVA